MNLENYRVEINNGRSGIPLPQLLDTNVLTSVLHQYAYRIGTDSLGTAGSLFLKRYAVLTAASSLDYYGLQRQRVDWFTTAEFEPETFTLLIDDSQSVLLQGDWKTRVFADHLTPLVEKISSEWRIPQKILWENIAVRLQSVFRKKSSVSSSDELQQQLKELTVAKASWVGGEDNPLSIYLHHLEEWTCIPVRTTCCRYYQVKFGDDHPYCGNCPLPKNETIK
ncbi:IucA/IucC family C-terminal-domain containing protein [Jeotgalibacillus soli]|nr:IucA/IucC family C-terminal-domain containing protein [Jeotgalibacillus soli]